MTKDYWTVNNGYQEFIGNLTFGKLQTTRDQWAGGDWR